MSATPLPEVNDAPARKPSAVEAWLRASAARVDALNALLVVQQGTSVKPLTWTPSTERPNRSIALVADRALREKRVLVRAEKRTAEDQSEGRQFVYLGFSMRIAGRPGAIAFRLLVAESEDDASVLRRVRALTLRRAEDQAESVAPNRPGTPGSEPLRPVAVQTKPVALPESVAELAAEQGVLLATVAALVDQPDFDQSLYALACCTAQQFRCLRVYVSCVVGRQLVIRAVSGIVDFDPRSALMVDVVEAMNETQMLACAIRLPDTSEDRVPPQSHASLAEQLNNPALMSVPLTTEGSVVGVLMLERDRAFDAVEAARLERLALLVSPLLALKTTDSMSAWQWLCRFFGRGMRSVFGPKRIGLKFGLLCLVLLVASSTTYTQMFRVDADAAIEARAQRAVVSGFPSFLSQVEARAGDLVQRGDVLARLNVEDLQLDRVKWQGEKDKLIKEYRATLAQRDRSKVRVLEAQRTQAQAKIDLIDAQIERATLRAPIDGVVISGDHFQSMGRPVERGELLFEVASLDDYRLILTLDEKDIGWVQAGSRGHLRLRSLAERSFPFEVTSVTPVSEPGAGVNTFRVEADIENLPESLRPGMEGVAKIEVQPRAVGWIWTRPFVNWIRMQFWKIGGF